MKNLQPLSSSIFEKRVMKQLVEAIIFEGILEYDEIPLIKGEKFVGFYLYGKKNTYYCKGKRTAFNRVRLKEGSSIYFIQENQTLTAVRLDEFVVDFLGDSIIAEAFLYELKQTIQFSEWNETYLCKPKSRRNSSFQELESELTEGHMYHPCFKARTGFSISDHALYGPEAKGVFPLRWAAVKRTSARVSLLEDEKNFWKRELGLHFWKNIMDELGELGKSFEEYTFLPIHPWQMKFIEEKSNEELILLESRGDTYRATQSVRTLWNTVHPKKAHIKLSMNMINTSSLRTLESHTVCAAPHISKWISEVVKSDEFLKDRSSLIILKEYAGVAFQPELKSSVKLGAIWRENVLDYMEEGEEAVPFTALPLVELDGFPFVNDWLRCYGIEKWLKQFLQISVIPVWHLLVAHGIAVEAHAQNMILIHKNGWPIRVALRDFHDSMEFNREYLSKPNSTPNFSNIHENFRTIEANQFYWMSSTEALRELVMDTLFVFHLTELSNCLEEHYQYDEEKFWEQVKSTINEHITLFPNLLLRHSLLQSDAPNIQVESLVKRKIIKGEGEVRHYVYNSLSSTNKAHKER
jgi:3,4-dihydroxybenzoyl-citryl-spermidine/N-citryl-spermidine--spermidine ligase